MDKTAKELFEELMFTYFVSDNEIYVVRKMSIYNTKNVVCKTEKLSFSFLKNSQYFTQSLEYYKLKRKGRIKKEIQTSISIPLPYLKAINQQLKELGWLNG